MNELMRFLSIDPALAPTFRLMVMLWIGIFGAAIGSFLNVVIYRLPIRQSLSYPGSRCPKCGHSIRSYDNIPIVSWLVLRGRCRDCAVRISPRYPMVEFFVSLMFVLMAALGPLSGNAETVSAWAPYAYQMTILCLLFSAAMIHYDGKPLPWKLIGFGIVVGSMVTIVWSDAVASPTSFGRWSLTARRGAFLGGAVGSALGAVVMAAKRNLTQDHPLDNLWLMMLVGMFFGWQSVAVVSMGVATIDLLNDLVTRIAPETLRIPRSGKCFVVTLASALTLDPLRLLISDHLGHDELFMLGSFVVTGLAALVSRQLLIPVKQKSD